MLIFAAGIIAIVVSSEAPPRPNTVQQPNGQMMTLDPVVIANLTAFPQATPLSDEDAGIWNDFLGQVTACDDYTPERRVQMEQHLQWLIDPSDMPPDVIMAMGGNPTERLIFGMAAYTSTQWRLAERQPDSCLIPIGLALNEMLVALGENPISVYDEIATPDL